jgi:hypothetical protein
MVNVVGSVVLGFIFMVLHGLYLASWLIKDIVRDGRHSDADRRYQERRERERYEKERYEKERRERERREREYY